MIALLRFKTAYFAAEEKIPLQPLVAIRNWSDPYFVSVSLTPVLKALRKIQLHAGPNRICVPKNRASNSESVLQKTPWLSAQSPSPVLVNSKEREPLFSTIDITSGFASSMLVSSHFSGKVWLPNMDLNSAIVAAQVCDALAPPFKDKSSGRKNNKRYLRCMTDSPHWADNCILGVKDERLMYVSGRPATGNQERNAQGATNQYDFRRWLLWNRTDGG